MITVRRYMELSLIGILLLTVVVQHLQYQHLLEILGRSGPVGYVLVHGRRWVMGPAVASGRGRAALVALEKQQEQQHQEHYHERPESELLLREEQRQQQRRARGDQMWGERCWVAGQPHVLVAVPFNPAMPEFLQQTLAAHLAALECGNPGLNLELALTSARPPSDPADPSGRGRIAAVRNLIVERWVVGTPRLELVFWLDADLTVVPSDLIARLHRANPFGVSAPLVLLDKQGAATFEPAGGGSGGRAANVVRFYDTAAFVQEGKPVGQDFEKKQHKNFGSISALPPYFDGASLPPDAARLPAASSPFWPTSFASASAPISSSSSASAVPRLRVSANQPAATSGGSGGNGGGSGVLLVDCDSVGTTYLIPADVYRFKIGPPPPPAAPHPSEGAVATAAYREAVAAYREAVAAAASAASTTYAVRHHAHVLTEHFPVVHAAKYLLGHRVVAVLAAPPIASAPTSSSSSVSVAAPPHPMAALFVAHAELPLFGEAYHGGSFDRARWEDIVDFRREQKEGLASQSLVAKTAVEVLLRSGGAGGTGGAGGGHGAGGSGSGRGGSGSESNHGATRACVEKVLEAIANNADGYVAQAPRERRSTIGFGDADRPPGGDVMMHRVRPEWAGRGGLDEKNDLALRALRAASSLCQ